MYRGIILHYPKSFYSHSGSFYPHPGCYLFDLARMDDKHSCELDKSYFNFDLIFVCHQNIASSPPPSSPRDSSPFNDNPPLSPPNTIEQQPSLSSPNNAREHQPILDKQGNTPGFLPKSDEGWASFDERDRQGTISSFKKSFTLQIISISNVIL